MIILPQTSDYISIQSLLHILSEQGESIALIFLGGVQYYTGQCLDMKTITTLAHQHVDFVLMLGDYRWF